MTEKPVEDGLGEVRDSCSRLLYRAEKLESDANIQTNKIVSETQISMERNTGVVCETRAVAEGIQTTTQHIDEKTSLLPKIR